MGALEPVDVFISYTGSDVAWAKWLDFILRAEGYTTRVEIYDSVVGKSPAAAELLHLCAFLAPEAIYVNELAAAHEHLPEGLAQAVSSLDPDHPNTVTGRENRKLLLASMDKVP
jgi:hypothetical protein